MPLMKRYMYTWQRQQLYSIFCLKIPSWLFVKSSETDHLWPFFLCSPREENVSWFMRKIKDLKCFLLTFLKESVFIQWTLWSRCEMSRTSDAKFSYLWFYWSITFIVFFIYFGKCIISTVLGRDISIKC